MTKGPRGREMELDREKVRQRIDREEGKIKLRAAALNIRVTQFSELRKKNESRTTLAKNQQKS